MGLFSSRPARVLSVDPGLHGSGAALFEGGKLKAAAYVAGAREGKRPDLWVPMARALVDWAGPMGAGDTIVVELMQVYERGKSKGDPADLLELAAIAGAVCALSPATVRRAYLPREHKGQVPKEIIHKRALSRLDLEEAAAIVYPRALKTLGHNVLDAVAMGLFHLGRLG